MYNTMTERWTFLYVVITKAEFFTKAWNRNKSRLEEEMGATNVAPSAARQDAAPDF